MSNGLRDALEFLGSIHQEKSEKIKEDLAEQEFAHNEQEVTGDGLNAYSVLPDDKRWSNVAWDDDDNEITVPSWTTPTIVPPPLLYTPANRIRSVWMLTEYNRPCECGSKYTSTPNLHKDWCPLYVDPMTGGRK